MNILIAGASGFIGQALVKALNDKHYNLTLLGRTREKLQRLFSTLYPIVTWDELNALDAKPFDVIINLCGHNIADGRWHDTTKQKIISSRVNSIEKLSQWLINHRAKPHFYQASAIGIYGYQNPEPITEDSIIPNHAHDFLNQVGLAWENALNPLTTANIPLTITRFGVVLDKNGGMLKKLRFSFYLGLGTTLGSGKQLISWVHLKDVVNSYLFLLSHPTLTGAFNITAPNPVTQAYFAKTLANSMHRPLLLTLPASAIKLLFGEMGESLLLNGQQVLPKRLSEENYAFCYPNLVQALATG